MYGGTDGGSEFHSPGSVASMKSSEMLAEYTTYEEAQAAVDTLSDEGFPVSNVTIVWSRLRRVEHVTGRRVTTTAAAQGALSGVWFGGFIGLLIAMFVDLDEGVSGFSVVLTYALVGAAVGAAFSAAQHWAQRGRRDFSSTGRLDAESYQVWVQPDHLSQAAAILGVSQSRPMDPDSA